MSAFYIEKELFNAQHGFSEDWRIRGYDPLIPPNLLRHEIPMTDVCQRTVLEARKEIRSILTNIDGRDRLLIIVGPSLIHDQQAAIEYCGRLVDQKDKYADDLLIVMRCFLEKPSSKIGWKGLIYDPDLDKSFKFNKGLKLARQLLTDLTGRGMPVVNEMLDTVSPQFFADLLSVGTVDARTTESESHRELASGLGFPVGFRNGTDGTLRIAIDAIRDATQPHNFFSITNQGLATIVKTAGNDDCFVVLKGYYDEESIAEVKVAMAKAGLRRRLVIDCSHGQSLQDYTKQVKVISDVARQISKGEAEITGVMIASNIHEGCQRLLEEGKSGLKYGVDITDACIGWEDTVKVLENLATAVRQRREILSQRGEESCHEQEISESVQGLDMNIDSSTPASLEGGHPESRAGPRSHNLIWSDKDTDAGTADSYYI